MHAFEAARIKRVPPYIQWLAAYSYPLYLVHGLYCTRSPISVFKFIASPYMAVPAFLLASVASAMLLNFINSKLIPQQKMLKPSVLSNHPSK